MIIEIVVIAEAGICLERDHFQETIVVIEPEVQVIVDRGQDTEPVLMEIG